MVYVKLRFASESAKPPLQVGSTLMTDGYGRVGVAVAACPMGVNTRFVDEPPAAVQMGLTARDHEYQEVEKARDFCNLLYGYLLFYGYLSYGSL